MAKTYSYNQNILVYLQHKMKQKYKMGDLIKLCSREMSFPKFIVEKPQKYW